METFYSLFKKEYIGELVLVILIIIYLILGLKTPEPIADLIDTLVGKIIIIIIVIYLFINANPILAILAIVAAFDLVRRSSMISNSSTLGALQKYAPSEVKKSSQFTAFNQFPYTLEQEVVAKMAPMVKTGCSLLPAPYKPHLDNTHDAFPLVNRNN
jgi:hypothetical protein